MKKQILKISEKLKKDEALLIESDANRFYFTGFSSSAGYVLITNDSSYFLVDFRYIEAAKKTVNSCEIVLISNVFEQIKQLLKKHNIKDLFIETNFVSISKYNSYNKIFEGFSISSDNKFDLIIRKLRSIKDESEIEQIKFAQKITDETFSYILNNISAGRTEKEIMLDMEFFLRKNGSEGVAFDFIVVSGENTSLPHGVATDRKIKNGDFITMDFGAVIGGYRSDMTRTVAVGFVSEEQRKVYGTVLNAQMKALEAIKPDKISKDIDKIARDCIKQKGYDGCFGHGLGHSVGIDIHEDPCFNTRCETPLKKGMVLTVEPGIYIENKFGVRIEDMVYITDNGCKNLTSSPKELIII